VELNIATLMLAQAIVLITFGGVSLGFINSRQGNQRYMNTWGWAFLTAGSGLLVRVLTPVIPEWIPIIVGNWLMGAGFTLFAVGAIEYRKRPIRYRLDLSILVIYLLGLIYIHLDQQPFATRVFFISSVLAVQNLRGAWHLLKVPSGQIRISEFFIGLPLLVGAVGLVLRIFSTVINPPLADDLLVAGASQAMFMILFLFLYTLLAIGMLQLNARLNEERLDKTIREREEALDAQKMLLREVNHRVKNNLMIIQSLLNIQANSVSDQDSRDALEDSRTRVRTIGELHHYLSSIQDLKNVDVGQLFEQLLDDTRVVMNVPENIRTHLRVSAGRLDIDIIVPLVLILNELVTNAFKYAFPDGEEGAVHVQLLKADQTGDYLMEVWDTGAGLPDSLNIESLESLGIRIIRSLVEQIHGQMHIESSPGKGAHVQINFPGTTAAGRIPA